MEKYGIIFKIIIKRRFFLPRQAREYSKSQIYHVIYKGIDSQDIFYKDIDKQYFLDKLLENKKEYKYKVFAYCLMSNHVHLVISINNEILSNAMKSLSLKYVWYFNTKYFRSGPLFQNRFKSKCVENQQYFLDVCRYVEQNPEKAGICNTDKYKWSSYHEYVEKEKVIDKDILLYYFDNSIKNYKDFTTKGKSDNKADFIEYELRDKMKDEELTELIIKEFNLNNITDFCKMTEKEFKKGIEFLRDLQYTNFSQISRVIRMNQYQLKKYWK